MKAKLLLPCVFALIIGAIVGFGFATSRMTGATSQGISSLYFADFQTVDAEDGRPINSRMSPGDVMIAKIHDGEQPQSLSAGFCMHSEANNGHWRIIWKEAPGGGRKIELSVEGYETIQLPAAMIQEVKTGGNITVGGILGPATVKMRKTQQGSAGQPPTRREFE